MYSVHDIRYMNLETIKNDIIKKNKKQKKKINKHLAQYSLGCCNQRAAGISCRRPGGE